jgi:hypothetical protein
MCLQEPTIKPFREPGDPVRTLICVSKYQHFSGTCTSIFALKMEAVGSSEMLVFMFIVYSHISLHLKSYVVISMMCFRLIRPSSGEHYEQNYSIGTTTLYRVQFCEGGNDLHLKRICFVTILYLTILLH